jgi:large subunit ribosomal protein L31
MKKETHPKYQEVLFIDSTTNYKFVCGSTLQPKERDTFEGKEYPAYRLSTSSASHPFFTGSKTLVDAEGRVDKFKKRYIGAIAKNKENQEEKEKQETQEPAKKSAKKK